MATAARDIVPVKQTRARKVDGRKNNRGVVGNRGGKGAEPWAPKPQRREVEGNPGVFREETEEQAWERSRQEVRHYTAIGYPMEVICRLMHPPICDKTLRKHFAYELENGRFIQDAKVAGTGYWLASSGRDPGMTRFWLRARMGWRDHGEIPSSGLEVQFKKIEGDDW